MATESSNIWSDYIDGRERIIQKSTLNRVEPYDFRVERARRALASPHLKKLLSRLTKGPRDFAFDVQSALEELIRVAEAAQAIRAELDADVADKHEEHRPSEPVVTGSNPVGSVSEEMTAGAAS